MNMNEMMATSPISVEKSARAEIIRAITSCQAGYIIPLVYIPLLREDRVTRGELSISFQMAETLYPLLNAVNVRVMAHFVSYMMFDRFDGFDSFNRSYQGIPEPATGSVIEHFPTTAFSKAYPFWKTLGVQWKEGAAINRAPLEAYNALVNWRRRARTDKLPERADLDWSLAEAFWKTTSMNDVVPDWDQSAMDGEVEVTLAQSRVFLNGLGKRKAQTVTPTPNMVVRQMKPDGSDSADVTYAYSVSPDTLTTTSGLEVSVSSTGTPYVFAELKDAGVTLSLANIELAKKTAAFAKLRERFDGIDEDHLIDLLMEGIRVPDEALKQPILLDSRSTVFGMTERHAMDGESLDVSRTTGQCRVGLRFRTPPMNTGGIILVTAEIVPDQLYERVKDVFLGTSDPATLPNFMRDYLDPEKVEVVQNDVVDVHHATPTAVFGYAPLNWRWKRNLTRAGGRFYRPNPDAFVEDRLRFWSADQVNPTLADDFYMVSDLPNSVFADTQSDPFEVVTLGTVGIVGNTVMGDPLTEDTGAYDEVMSQVDTSRIVQVPVPPAVAAADLELEEEEDDNA